MAGECHWVWLHLPSPGEEEQDGPLPSLSISGLYLFSLEMEQPLGCFLKGSRSKKSWGTVWSWKNGDGQLSGVLSYPNTAGMFSMVVSHESVVRRAAMCVPNTLNKSQSDSQGHCERCRLGISECTSCKQVGASGLSSTGCFGSFWLRFQLDPRQRCWSILQKALTQSSHSCKSLLAPRFHSFTHAVCWGQGARYILIQHGTVHNCLGSLSVHKGGFSLCVQGTKWNWRKFGCRTCTSWNRTSAWVWDASLTMSVKLSMHWKLDYSPKLRY